MQEFGLAPVMFVKRQPSKPDAIGERPVQQFQGDLPLGPIDDLIGNPGLPTAFPVLRPGFWQEQFAGEKAMKIIGRIAQVNGDDAVFDLACSAAVLPLDSWSLGAFLGASGFIKNSDGVWVGMVACHKLMYACAHALLVPFQKRQELLQGSRCHILGKSDGLDALARQVGQLAVYIDGQVRPRTRIPKTVVKLTQIATELRSQTTNLCGIHAGSSQVLTKAGA